MVGDEAMNTAKYPDKLVLTVPIYQQMNTIAGRSRIVNK